MHPDTFNDVMTAARLFHSTDISALLEEAQLEAREKRRKAATTPARDARQSGACARA